MIETISSSVLYSISKDVVLFFLKKRKRITPSELLALRQKWRPLFEEELNKNFVNRLREDVIIHDIEKFKSYPNGDGKNKGISPWFKAYLIDTYNDGILVWLKMVEVKKNENGLWRLSDIENGEDADMTAFVSGKIPFKYIDFVEWDGDDHYYFPHIYCYFRGPKKQPYESISLYRESKMPGHRPRYIELAPWEEVRKLSKSMGISA